MIMQCQNQYLCTTTLSVGGIEFTKFLPDFFFTKFYVSLCLMHKHHLMNVFGRVMLYKSLYLNLYLI